MAGTISQRITLEGGADVKKKLEELGKAGEKSFKQIQDAAEKTKIDPARVDETKKAFDNLGTAGAKLGTQFTALANSVLNFGAAGVKSFADVATAATGTAQAAQQVGTSVGQASQQIATSGQSASAKLISTAKVFGLVAAGIVAAIGAITTALTKGAGETAKTIAEQADKLKLSIPIWVELRKAITGAGLSFDDFVKGAGKTVDLVAKMKEELAKASKVFKLAEGPPVTVTDMSKLTKETANAVGEFLRLGVSMKTLREGDNLAILRETAAVINRIPDAAIQAAAGVKFFGDNWKDVIKVLLSGKTATVDSEEAMRKASRELTADQVQASNKARDAWEDLGRAIRATKDLVGAFFAPGSAAQAQWLTQLVDGSRELLKIWLGLSQQGRKGFLENIGDTAVTTAFKVLVAIGEQLSGLWRDVLVPAGEKLMEVIEGIAANFKGVTSAQVLAFFISAAVAVTGLAIAFKSIAFVLSPFTALIGLFVGFGPVLIPLIALVVLFWDQIKAGASAVAAMLPTSIAKLKQAFATLLSGDFAGAWTQFSKAAVEAFETIRLHVVSIFNDIRQNGDGVFADLIRMIAGDQIKTPWLAELIKNIKELGAELPATIALLVAAFIGLRAAGVALAPILTRLFGVEVSGTGAIVLAIVGQMTGAFNVLSAVVTAVAGVFTTLVAIVTLIGLAFGTTAAAIAGVIALLPVLAALIFIFWDQLAAGAIIAWKTVKLAASDAIDLITRLVTTPIANAWQWITDKWNEAVASVQNSIAMLRAFITEWVTTPIANAWQWMKDAFQSVLDWAADKWAKFKAAVGFGGGAAGGQVGGSAGFAGGGLLGGRGTGTSDSNLAWLSRGEYIIPARIVQQPGMLAFLEALRRAGHLPPFAGGGLIGGIPAYAGGGLAQAVGDMTTLVIRGITDVLIRFAARASQIIAGLQLEGFAAGGLVGGRGNSMGRFALGGMVSAPLSIPAFAGGGMSRDLGTLTLGLPGGGTVSVQASSDVVDQLRKAAALAQVRSGGRKPSRYS